MLPRNHPDRIQIAFDDHHLVANAGLILPSTLALHLGLPQLVDQRLDLGNAPGRANTGDKIMTLVASALAGGDCIDDADVLRTGGTARTLGGTVKAPSTLGTFLRSFRWGHVRQLDRVSRELLARAWSAGAGPGDAPFTIDLDSTICETYGPAKEGARDHGYTGKRGYHPMTVAGAIDDEQTIEQFVESVLEAPVNQRNRGDHDGPRYFLGIRLADGTSVVRAFWLEAGELSRGIMTDPVVTLSVWWELPNEHLPVGTDGGPRISERLAARLGLAQLSFNAPELVVTGKPHSPTVRLMRRHEFEVMQWGSPGTMIR